MSESEATANVRFLAVPVEGYLALMEHNDSLIREMDLVAAASRGPSAVPQRLLQLATEARTRFGRYTSGYRHIVEEAAVRGERTVDLETDYLLSNIGPSQEFVRLLEEADDFARRGDLLAPPTPAPVAHLRRWFVDELARQVVDGEPPAPFDPSRHER